MMAAADNSRGWRLANAWAVPRTGNTRRRGHQHRRPRHAGFFRALAGCVESFRGEKLPPTAWDDIHIAASYSKCWKRHRKTQYHRLGK